MDGLQRDPWTSRNLTASWRLTGENKLTFKLKTDIFDKKDLLNVVSKWLSDAWWYEIHNWSFYFFIGSYSAMLQAGFIFSSWILLKRWFCPRFGEQACTALLDNFFNDGLSWHDTKCNDRRHIVCEVSVCIDLPKPISSFISLVASASTKLCKFAKLIILHFQDLPVGNINFVRQQNPGINIP